MGGLNFANFLFPNTLYTSPIYFQWGILAIISLKSSGLKASKGRREIRDTNPLSLFSESVISLADSCSQGGRGRRETIWRSVTLYFCDFVAVIH